MDEIGEEAEHLLKAGAHPVNLSIPNASMKGAPSQLSDGRPA